MPLNIPNTLTWARIVMIPIFVGIFYLPDALMPVASKNLVATLIFVAAAVTDWFDGWLARRRGHAKAGQGGVALFAGGTARQQVVVHDQFVRRAQTGYLYHYALVMIVGVLLFMTDFVWLKK